jgi:hypothetical protein
MSGVKEKFSRVLLAVDGPDSSMAVADYAVAIAKNKPR